MVNMLMDMIVDTTRPDIRPNTSTFFFMCVVFYEPKDGELAIYRAHTLG